MHLFNWAAVLRALILKDIEWNRKWNWFHSPAVEEPRRRPGACLAADGGAARCLWQCPTFVISVCVCCCCSQDSSLPVYVFSKNTNHTRWTKRAVWHVPLFLSVAHLLLITRLCCRWRHVEVQSLGSAASHLLCMYCCWTVGGVSQLLMTGLESAWQQSYVFNESFLYYFAQ